MLFAALFQKLEKSALIFGKNFPIGVIYGLNVSFKMQLLRVSRVKKLFFCVAFFSRVVAIWSKCPNSKKTPPPPKNSWLLAWIHNQLLIKIVNSLLYGTGSLSCELFVNLIFLCFMWIVCSVLCYIEDF